MHLILDVHLCAGCNQPPDLRRVARLSRLEQRPVGFRLHTARKLENKGSNDCWKTKAQANLKTNAQTTVDCRSSVRAKSYLLSVPVAHFG